MTTAMRDSGNDVFENDIIRIKYTAPTTRKTVDTNVLKATYPDIYDEVIKETPVKDKITVTYKEEK